MRKIIRLFKGIRRKNIINRFKSYGNNLILDLNNSVFSYEHIAIGNNVFIGGNAYFAAILNIGNNVMFGPGVTILGGDHLFGVIGESVRFLKPKNNENTKEVIIEDEVWCGANVTILKGVNLGIGCVIGAGSVVTKSIPPFTVAVGNPCKFITTIFSDNELYIHLSKLGYDKDFIEMVITKRNRMLKA